MKTCYTIVFALLLFGCNSLQKQKTPALLCFDNNFHQKVEKTLLNVEEIKKLNGKFVEVEGVFRYNFEDVALYPSESSELSEAIWINLTLPQNIPDSLIRSFDDKRVLIIGKVNMTKRGHLNGYMATLDSAFCIKRI